MFFASPSLLRQAANAARREDAALQRFLRDTTAPLQRSAPQFNADTTEAGTTLQIDVPGLAREQLQLHIEDNLVHLQSVEGAPRSVRRSWELPHAIDAASSQAKLEHGVLTLTLARLQPVEKKVALTIA